MVKRKKKNYIEINYIEMPFLVCFFGMNLWMLRFLQFMSTNIHMSSSSLLLNTAFYLFLSISSSFISLSLPFIPVVQALLWSLIIVHNIEIFTILPLHFQIYIYSMVSAIIFNWYSGGCSNLYYIYKPCFDGFLCFFLQ